MAKEKASKERILGIVATCVVLLSVIPLGSNRVWAWVTLYILFTLYCVAALLSSRTYRQRLIFHSNRLVLSAMLMGSVSGWLLIQPFVIDFFSSGSATVPVHVDTSRAAVYALRLVAYTWIFLIGACIAGSLRDSRRILQGIGVFTTLIALGGLISLAADLEILNRFKSVENFKWATGTFVNQNSYALYASFGLIINLALFARVPGDIADELRRGGRLIHVSLKQIEGATVLPLVGIVANFVGLISSGSRAGMLSGLFGMIVFLFLTTYRGQSRSLRSAVFVALPVMLLLAFVGSQILTRFYFGTGHDGLRLEIYTQALRLLQDTWLFGSGLGGFEEAFVPYLTVELSWLRWNVAHNSYLELAVELGVPAATAFFISIGLVLLSILVRARKSEFNRTLPNVALACATAGAAHSFVDFSLQMPATASLFALILGLAWGIVHPVNPEAVKQATRPTKRRVRRSATRKSAT